MSGKKSRQYYFLTIDYNADSRLMEYERCYFQLGDLKKKFESFRLGCVDIKGRNDLEAIIKGNEKSQE